jgi:hypothetical protein
MRQLYSATLFFIYIITFQANAQDIVPLDYNPAIKEYLSTNGIQAAERIQGGGDTLTLPFVDDFSEQAIYPSAMRWVDNKVFINSQMGRKMPTVGVATFDGLDELGNAYLPGNTSGSTDVLTSKPIKLLTTPQGGTYTLADSIYMSFYFEKRGYGDEPEISDSLILEYYRPSSGTWTREWFSLGASLGGTDTAFTKVDVLITNADYLQDGFQFRFRSYGNLSGALDNWHIDYVRLYAATITSVLIDQAFTDDKKSILQGFTSVPWPHYKANGNQQALIADFDTMKYTVYSNNSSGNIGYIHRAFAYNGDSVGGFGLPSNQFFIQYNQRNTFDFPINYTYPNSYELNNDSSYFDLIDNFSTPLAGDNITSNDSVYLRQYFYNHYSYDDGTCEAAFDLTNAPGGKIAMRFDMLQADTLRGVQVFWAQQGVDVSNKLITLKVWSSLSPENVIYQMTNQFPTYVDSINGFATYVFTAPVFAQSFYMGFQQVAGDPLHLGYDKNTISNATGNSKMFYNITGLWSFANSVPGSFMIRPLVGSEPLVGIKENHKNKGVVSCYPNPSSGLIYINAIEDAEDYSHLSVYDVTGKKVFKSDFKPGYYNFSFLSPGIYTVHLSGNYIYAAPAKLIINK